MHKLLIVDDSSTLRRIMRRVLREADLDIDDFLEARSGAEALKVLEAHPDIGLVLSDVDMPGMDGVDFVRALRAREKNASVPIILVATESARTTAQRAIDQGANGCVSKPFTPDSIRAALEPHIH